MKTKVVPVTFTVTEYVEVPLEANEAEIENITINLYAKCFAGLPLNFKNRRDFT